MFRMIYTMTRTKRNAFSVERRSHTLWTKILLPFSPGSEIYEHVAEEFLIGISAAPEYVHNEKSAIPFPPFRPLSCLDGARYFQNHLADATIRRIIKELPKKMGKLSSGIFRSKLSVYSHAFATDNDDEDSAIFLVQICL